MPIKLQNQIMDILRLFIDKKDRRRVENFAKAKLKYYHDAIIEDTGE